MVEDVRYSKGEGRDGRGHQVQYMRRKGMVEDTRHSTGEGGVGREHLHIISSICIA